MDDHDFHGAFDKIEGIAYLGNFYLARHEFWNLVRGDVDSAKLDLLEELLFINFELLRILSILL